MRKSQIPASRKLRSERLGRQAAATHQGTLWLEYSVHDLTRIGTSKKKLAALIDAGIFAIENVPDDFELTEKQRHQVNAAKTGQSFIDKAAIGAALAEMQSTTNYIPETSRGWMIESRGAVLRQRVALSASSPKGPDLPDISRYRVFLDRFRCSDA